MALHYSDIAYDLREVDLKNKPQAMLDISPKGTVPVLQLTSGEIIEESLEIMHYAIAQNDPESICAVSKETDLEIQVLIQKNDIEFAKLLRKYKYFEKHKEETQESYRKQIEDLFLIKYENMLEGNDFLFGKKSLADIATLPFIRQFALVDEDWFFESRYKNLIRWLNSFICNENFKSVIMAKHPTWKESSC